SSSFAVKVLPCVREARWAPNCTMAPWRSPSGLVSVQSAILKPSSRRAALTLRCRAASAGVCRRAGLECEDGVVVSATCISIAAPRNPRHRELGPQGDRHAVEQLADKAQRVDLVVVLARREAQELGLERPVPCGLSRHVQAVVGHMTTDRLGPYH